MEKEQNNQNSPAPQVAPQANPTTATSTELQPNVAAALSYVLGFITGLFFYLTSKDKFVRFHAMQSIIFSVVAMVANTVLSYIPFFGMLAGLLGLGELVLYIVLVVKAYQGQKMVLPVIGVYAEKYS